MHMKDNANINNKQHINENFPMLPSERLIRDEVKDCASFGGGCVFALIIVMNMIQM